MIHQVLLDFLQQMQPDAISYRHRVDQLFEFPSNGLADWRNRYLDQCGAPSVARLTWHQRAGDVRSATGAGRAIVLGKVTYG